MSEPEIYKPDLDKIDRISADTFFIKRQNEFARKVEEVKESGPDLLWLAYGLLLKYGNELSHLVPLMQSKGLPGWLILAVKGAAWVIGYQSRRLKQ